MKCIRCIKRAKAPIDRAVEMAAEAVTIADGEALCIEHLDLKLKVGG